MERGKTKTEITGFVPSSGHTGGYGARAKHKYRYKRKTSRYTKSNGNVDPFYASSMLIKFGICAAACAAVLLLKWSEIPAADGALQVLKTAINEETDPNDALGKLKFVELPGMIQVFADSGKLSPPIASHSRTLLEEDMLLVLNASSDSSVKASVSGTVKETGIDPEYGNYIRIRAAHDTDLFLYGLSKVTAEVGQPVQKTDDVGNISMGDSLFIRLTVAGRPQNPEDHFSEHTGRF